MRRSGWPAVWLTWIALLVSPVALGLWSREHVLPRVHLGGPVLPGLGASLHVAALALLAASVVAPRWLRRQALGWYARGARVGLRRGALAAGAGVAVVVIWSLGQPREMGHQWMLGLGAVAVTALVVARRGERAAWVGALLWALLTGAMLGRMWVAPLALGAAGAVLARCARHAPREHDVVPRALVLVGLLSLLWVRGHPLGGWTRLEGAYSQGNGRVDVALRGGEVLSLTENGALEVWAEYERRWWGAEVWARQWNADAADLLELSARVQLWPFALGWGTRRGVLAPGDDAELRAAEGALRFLLEAQRRRPVSTTAERVTVGSASMRWADIGSVETERVPASRSRQVWVHLQRRFDSDEVPWRLTSVSGAPGFDALVEAVPERLGIDASAWREALAARPIRWAFEVPPVRGR